MCSRRIWSVPVQWELMKLSLLKRTVDILVQHTSYQNRIRSKFSRVIQRYYYLRMVIRLQRTVRWHRLRKYFWATKVVKGLFMDYFLIWLIKRRKRREAKRQLEEDEACERMVDRAHLYLRKHLQSAEGSAMLWTYLREVSCSCDDGLSACGRGKGGGGFPG